MDEEREREKRNFSAFPYFIVFLPPCARAAMLFTTLYHIESIYITISGFIITAPLLYISACRKDYNLILGVGKIHAFVRPPAQGRKKIGTAVPAVLRKVSAQ